MVSRSHTGSIVGRQEQEDKQEEGVSRSGELLQSIAIIDRLQEGGVLKTVIVVTVVVVTVMVVTVMVVTVMVVTVMVVTMMVVTVIVVTIAMTIKVV